MRKADEMERNDITVKYKFDSDCTSRYSWLYVSEISSKNSSNLLSIVFNSQNRISNNVTEIKFVVPAIVKIYLELS